MADSQGKQVRNYVQGLGQHDRYIVLLYYADGLTPMEISRVLDLPSTAVQTRLNELRTHLADLTTPKAHANTTAPPPAGSTVSAYA